MRFWYPPAPAARAPRPRRSAPAGARRRRSAAPRRRELPDARRPGEEIRERLRLAAEIAGERDRREHLRARHRDARIRGDQALLGLDQVGPPQQQLGGHARRHHRGAARARCRPRVRPRDTLPSMMARGLRPSSTASAASWSRSRSSGGSCARAAAVSASSWRQSNSEIRPPSKRLRCSSSASSRRASVRRVAVDLRVERAQREVRLGDFAASAMRTASRAASVASRSARAASALARRRPQRSSS